MKKDFLFLLAILLSVVFPAAANFSSHCWTGLYVGVQGGYGWSSDETKINPLPDAASFGDLKPTTLNIHSCGGFGGGQHGYNVQWRNLVFGIEADIAGGTISSKVNKNIIQNNGTPFPGGSIEVKQRTDWFGTVRPRLGYLVSNCALLYATGGFAYGRTHYEANTDFRQVEQYPIAFNKLKTGWTVGAGVEYVLCGNWSLKAEYLFYDLGDMSKTANPIPPMSFPVQVGYRFETFGNLIRIGLNYKFSHFISL